MKSLIGRSGHVTLDRPVRAVAPGSGAGSVRLVAFEGKLVEIEDGTAAFDVDGLILHPDDALDTKGEAGLGVYAPPADHTRLHVRIDNVSGFQELHGFTRVQREQDADPGVVESEGFSREKRLRFAALSLQHASELGDKQLDRMRRLQGREMSRQEFANHVNEEMGDLHQRLMFMSLAVQALCDPAYDPKKK